MSKINLVHFSPSPHASAACGSSSFSWVRDPKLVTCVRCKARRDFPKAAAVSVEPDRQNFSLMGQPSAVLDAHEEVNRPVEPRVPAARVVALQNEDPKQMPTSRIIMWLAREAVTPPFVGRPGGWAQAIEAMQVELDLRLPVGASK